MNGVDCLDRGAGFGLDRPCLVDGPSGRTLSYGEVRDHTLRVADRLRRYGVHDGARAAVLTENSVPAALAVLGLMRAGLVWVPLNARNAIEESARSVDRLGCAALFVSAAFADRLEQLVAAAPRLRVVVLLPSGEAPLPATGPSTVPVVPLDAWLSGPVPAELPLPDAPDRTFSVQSTGGTTGEPRGVVTSTRAFTTWMANFAACLPAVEDAVFLATAPISHAAGILLQHVLLTGGATALFPASDPATVLDAIGRYRVTHVFLPPTVVYGLLGHPTLGDGDYSSLRYLVYGAAPMAPEKLREAIAAFGPVLCQIYGQTEAGVPVTFLSPRDHFTDRLGGRIAPPERLASCGRPTPFARVAVLRPDGSRADVGEVGEIAIGGAGVMDGYDGLPAETSTVRSGEWLLTGDIGRFDGQGYLSIVDRARDMIITGGFNVYSTEVERAVLTHPGVADCCVIGVPHEKWGEAVTAVVERRPGHQVTEAELRAVVRELLGPVKTPKTVMFVDRLPRSPVGKVLKRMVRDAYWTGRDRAVS